MPTSSTAYLRYPALATPAASVLEEQGDGERFPCHRQWPRRPDLCPAGGQARLRRGPDEGRHAGKRHGLRAGRHRVGVEPGGFLRDRTVEDTLVAGAGLCHRDVVDFVVRDGPDRIRELIALGTNFSLRDGTEDTGYDLGREGGHQPPAHPARQRRHRPRNHARAGRGRARRTQHPHPRTPRRHRPAHRRQVRCRDHRTRLCWGAYVARPPTPGRSNDSRRAPRSWQPAGQGRSTSTPAIPTSRPATASPWRTAPACPIGQHGVHPVPSDLPVPPRRPNRSSSPRPCAGEGAILRRPDGEAVHAALPRRRRTGAARHRRPRHR